MKVLVVNTVTFCRNGITGVILNIYKNIDKKKVQMDFVATDFNTEQWVKDIIVAHNSKFYEIDRSYKGISKYVAKLTKIAKGYDVIHIHGNSSSMVFELIAGKLAGIKKRIAHSHNTTCSHPKMDKIMRPLFYLFCNGRLACGEEAGTWMFKHRPFIVINNGIDTEAYRFCEAERIKERKKLGITNESLIGHVGRLNEQKNQSFLLDVLKKIVNNNDDIKLVLIGDGPFEEKLREKARNMEITEKVIFAGAVNNVNQLLNALDLVVMPSLYEGLPLTLVEEQANGLICVVADTITEEVNISGNIRFISLNASLEVWADRILNELTDRSRCESSEQSIQLIREKGFDINKTVRTIAMVYGLQD